ncbi:MAG: type II secretion system protein [Planctomycetes bacterium]|nr:type II secretion system protein [Planctomycetota bacterium]
MNRSSTSAAEHCRAAFTLIEALVAVSITAIAGTVLLLGTTSSLQATDDSLRRTIALGLAEQLLDEVLGARYMEYGTSPYPTSLSPGGDEAATGTRELFDDVDDYNGVLAQPPEDPWGVPLGTEGTAGAQRHPNFQLPPEFFDRWRQEVSVYYVSESDLATPLAVGQTSDYRAVDVRIVRDDPQRGVQELARLRRVVSYVPPQ